MIIIIIVIVIDIYMHTMIRIEQGMKNGNPKTDRRKRARPRSS